MALLSGIASQASLARFRPRSLLRAPDARVSSSDERGTTLQVDGLFCGLCARRVSSSLSKLDSVTSATCDLDTATATVQLGGRVDEAELKQAVLDAAIAMPLRRLVERVARSVGH